MFNCEISLICKNKISIEFSWDKDGGGGAKKSCLIQIIIERTLLATVLNLFIYTAIVSVSFITVQTFFYDIWAIFRAIFLLSIKAYLLRYCNSALHLISSVFIWTSFKDLSYFSSINANMLNALIRVIKCNTSRLF